MPEEPFSPSRPFTDKRPFGPFIGGGPPEFTRGHKEPPSECSKKLCLGDMTKGEVFANISKSFLHHKRGFRDFLEKRGVDVGGIAIVGSVARGDFGCREMGSIDVGLDSVYTSLKDERGVRKEELEKMFDIFDNSDNPREFYRGVDREIGNQMILDEILKHICSDVDVVAEVPLNQRELSDLNKEYGFTDKIESDIESNLSPVEIFSYELDGEYLSTRDQFEEVISEYYPEVDW